MRRRTTIFSALVLLGGLLVNTQSTAEEKVEIPDVDLGTNPVFDLADTPLGLTILQHAAIKFRDSTLQSRLTSDINALVPMISEQISGKPLGYLLEVNVYSGEGDILQIPDGQLISLVGFGSEPTDALAELKRIPRLSVQPPAGTVNRSFYVWLAPEGDKLKATVMTPEFSRGIESVATNEAIRRDRLAMFERVDSATLEKAVQRAEFWEDVFQRRQSEVADAASIIKLGTLNREMTVLQDQVNKLYSQFQEAVAASKKANGFIEAMQFINMITSVMSAGIQAGNAISDLGPVNSSGKPAISGDRFLEYYSIERTEQNNIITERATLIRVKLDSMKVIDAQIKQEWQSQGVTIPARDMPSIELNLKQP